MGVYDYKQIIVMRKDLGMRKGKMIAQGAHASMAAYLKDPQSLDVLNWLAGSFAKIAVSVDSEEELLEVYKNAKEAGIITSLITDSGVTEFGGVPTNTCIAVGPAHKNKLEKITGHLKLL